MVLDTKSVSSTEETTSQDALKLMAQISEWPKQQSSMLQENLTKTVLLDYNELPKTTSQTSSKEEMHKDP